MRIQKRLTLAAAAAAALAFAVTALADNTHDTVAAPKTVTVNVKDGWHVNQDYPWKLVYSDKDLKLDKTHFVLAEHSAAIKDAPSGAAVLKGAVCSGDQCQTFADPVTIP